MEGEDESERILFDREAEISRITQEMLAAGGSHLVFVRHGQRLDHVKVELGEEEVERILADVRYEFDTPLSPEGHKQAGETGKYLA